jgi:hypothetical protein
VRLLGLCLIGQREREGRGRKRKRKEGRKLNVIEVSRSSCVSVLNNIRVGSSSSSK